MPCPSCLCDQCQVVDVYPLLPSIYPVQDESENWKVLCHWVSQLVTGKAVFVKRDFVTDGMSDPRSVWAFIGSPLDKTMLKHALAHDGLYAAELMTREECDKWFLNSMLLGDIGKVKAYAIYSAVRIGGGFVWKAHTPESIAEARRSVRLLSFAEWHNVNVTHDVSSLQAP